MVVWFSLKPTEMFTKQELTFFLRKLAQFHYEQLGFRKNGYDYFTALRLEFLDDLFSGNATPKRMNFRNVFMLSSCDSKVADSWLCNDGKGAKQKVASRNLRTLQQWDKSFEAFELQSNYEY